MTMATDHVETAAATDATKDHSKARLRGERLELLSSRLLTELEACGYLRGERRDVRVSLIRILVDDLYGNQSVDLPLSCR